MTIVNIEKWEIEENRIINKHYDYIQKFLSFVLVRDNNTILLGSNDDRIARVFLPI